MARLLSDENFPRPVVEALRSLGHDVQTMTDLGWAGKALPDETVLLRAAELGRAVITLNRRHFIRLHQQRSAHAGVIVCTLDPDFAGQASRVDAAIREHNNLAGALIRVNRPAG